VRALLPFPAAAAALLLAAPACVRVDLPRPPALELYLLDAAPPPGPPVEGRPPLLVAAPRAAPGVDGKEIVYLERAHEVRRYARSAWVDTPARMLAPLLARALEQGGFRVAREGEAGAERRLETELLQLRQEFLARPSAVRLVLRARLLGGGGRPVAEREIEVEEPAPSDDAYGAVVAANRAVSAALAEVVALCAEATAGPAP
jgi:cholesterol transport system auxiliary component